MTKTQKTKPSRFTSPVMIYQMQYDSASEILESMIKSNTPEIEFEDDDKLVICQVQTPEGLKAGLRIESALNSDVEYPELTGLEIPISTIDYYIENNKPHPKAELLEEALEIFDVMQDTIFDGLGDVELKKDFYFDPICLISRLMDSKEFFTPEEFKRYTIYTLRKTFLHIPKDKREEVLSGLFDKSKSFALHKLIPESTFRSELLNVPFIEANDEDNFDPEDELLKIFDILAKYSPNLTPSAIFIYILKLMRMTETEEIKLDGDLGSLYSKSFSANCFESTQEGLFYDNGLRFEVTGLNTKVAFNSKTDEIEIIPETNVFDFIYLIAENYPVLQKAIDDLRKKTKTFIPPFEETTFVYRSIANQLIESVSSIPTFFTDLEKAEYANLILKQRYGALLTKESDSVWYYTIQEIRMIHILFLDEISRTNIDLIRNLKPVDELIRK